MIKETWEQIKSGQNVRKNLSVLRGEIKEADGRTTLLSCMESDEETLVALLKSEDAKTRKNAALLMGDLGKQHYLKPLYEAYVNESKLFVKSAYLAAVKNLDYREYLSEFKERLHILSKSETDQESEKHVREELRELSNLVLMLEGVRMHKFCEGQENYEIILLTNRNFREVTEESLKEFETEARTKLFNAGVMAKVKALDWVNQIRTYQELLFRIDGMKTCPMEPFEAAKVIASSELLHFMEKNHKGPAPFYFRIEFKSKMDLDKKSDFTKKLSSQLEKLTDRRLINTTSSYELEIRLVENKEGSLNILVKLCTLTDERFAYRKEVTSASIRPVNAALTVALAREFLKEDGAVLDPFCGVGTMLIERHKAVKANTTYGIDIQEDAILKARENTKHARQIIHYINRDFFDFTHEYLFDEIITDMPFKLGRITEEEIAGLYRRFFKASAVCLKERGILVLYSHNREHVKKMSPSGGFVLLREFEISKKEGTFVMVLRKEK